MVGLGFREEGDEGMSGDELRAGLREVQSRMWVWKNLREVGFRKYRGALLE